MTNWSVYHPGRSRPGRRDGPAAGCRGLRIGIAKLLPMSKPTPAAGTLPVSDALSRSAPLAALMQRVRDSNARYEAVRAALPPALAALVRPGPLDEGGWTLLVPSGAAAAKLRQCLPTLQAALRTQGWGELAIRVKVQV